MGRCGAIFSISSAIALASYAPTQIGSMVSLLISLSITIGVFAVGSIIRPRIFISISITLSCPLGAGKSQAADRLAETSQISHQDRSLAEPRSNQAIGRG